MNTNNTIIVFKTVAAVMILIMLIFEIMAGVVTRVTSERAIFKKPMKEVAAATTLQAYNDDNLHDNGNTATPRWSSLLRKMSIRQSSNL